MKKRKETGDLLFLVILFVFLMVFALGSKAHAGSPLTIGVTPRIQIWMPGNDVTVRLSIRIPRHENNRKIRVEWTPSAQGRQHIFEREIQGEENEERLSPFYFTGLLPNEYTVKVCLARSSGTTHCVSDIAYVQ